MYFYPHFAEEPTEKREIKQIAQDFVDLGSQI